MHIPEPRKHLVRYYGAYSDVSGGKRKQSDRQRGPSGGTDLEPASQPDREVLPVIGVSESRSKFAGEWVGGVRGENPAGDTPLKSSN